MSVMERVLALVAPHICVVCSEEGNPVCNGCQNDIVTSLPSSCFLCNAATDDFLTCFSCRRSAPLRHVWRAADYSPVIKKIVAEFKFERKRALAVPLAHIMQQTLPYHTDQPIITYVPTATSRRRARGYDHAELLAKALSRQTRWPAHRVLARVGQTRQVGSSRIARRRQASNAYRSIRTSVIKGRTVLLVDDITTTGATLTAAGLVLRRAGAKAVDAVVIARKDRAA